MPAVRHIDPASENGERAALVLKPGIEMLSADGQRLGDVDRPARQWRAVLERQGEHPVMRSRRVADHRAEIDRLHRLVDDRRAGDPQRVDVAARLRRQRDRPAQGPRPELAPRLRVNRVNIVILGGDDQRSGGRPRRLPIERLGIEMTGKLRVKARVEMQ
jgi:hypothetical protein